MCKVALYTTGCGDVCSKEEVTTAILVGCGKVGNGNGMRRRRGVGQCRESRVPADATKQMEGVCGVGVVLFVKPWLRNSLEKKVCFFPSF